MHKYGFIMLLLFGMPCAAASAQQRPQTPSPAFRVGPLRLEELSFTKSAGNCQQGPCMTASIDYLRVISAENAQAVARLTAGIADWALRMDKGKAAKNPEEWLQWWVDREWKIRQEGGEPADSPPWEDRSTLKVEYQSARVLSLSQLSYGYYGGAHGHQGLSYANFRPATGQPIRLTDIFKEGYAAPLNAIGERRFRELEGLSPRESFKEANFRFPNDRFQLDQNFAVGAKGLTFYFDADEIAWHAAGPIKLYLPYTDVQNLLRPGAGIP
jgi:hypothetical protein